MSILLAEAFFFFAFFFLLIQLYLFRLGFFEKPTWPHNSPDTLYKKFQKEKK